MASADPELLRLAREWTETKFEADPNEPDEDTYYLRFPRAVELVESRRFWKEHLPELMAAFASSPEVREYLARKAER